jgi:hypothetical protein
VANHIHRRNVARQQQQTLFALSQSLDDLLDAALELAGLGSLFGSAEQLLLEFALGERVGDGGDGVCGDVEFGLCGQYLQLGMWGLLEVLRDRVGVV